MIDSHDEGNCPQLMLGLGMFSLDQIFCPLDRLYLEQTGMPVHVFVHMARILVDLDPQEVWSRSERRKST